MLNEEFKIEGYGIFRTPNNTGILPLVEMSMPVTTKDKCTTYDIEKYNQETASKCHLDLKGLCVQDTGTVIGSYYSESSKIPVHLLRFIPKTIFSEGVERYHNCEINDTIYTIENCFTGIMDITTNKEYIEIFKSAINELPVSDSLDLIRIAFDHFIDFSYKDNKGNIYNYHNIKTLLSNDTSIVTSYTLSILKNEKRTKYTAYITLTKRDNNIVVTDVKPECLTVNNNPNINIKADTLGCSQSSTASNLLDNLETILLEFLETKLNYTIKKTFTPLGKNNPFTDTPVSNTSDTPKPLQGVPIAYAIGLTKNRVKKSFTYYRPNGEILTIIDKLKQLNMFYELKRYIEVQNLNKGNEANRTGGQTLQSFSKRMSEYNPTFYKYCLSILGYDVV